MRIEPSSDDPESIRKIRKDLDNAGFSETNLLERLRETHFPGARHRRSTGKDRQLPDKADRLDILIHLFVFGQPVTKAAFASALSISRTEDWTAARMIRRSNGLVSSNFEICAYEDILAIADWPGSREADGNDVMGIAASSLALLQMTVRRPVNSVFDLGCGCGIQSIAAARHSVYVTGTDLNPRAVVFSRFNALFNNVSNVSFREAALFDGVGNETFSLVVCNPPFVIGPRTLQAHTSPGFPGDKFCESIVHTAPAYLEPGGFAQFVCNWAQVGSETSQEHIQKWVDEGGCDSWILRSHSETPEKYARNRADENAPDADAADKLYEEWLRYFEREDITAVNFGVITLRRSRAVRSWSRFDEMPEISGSCGNSIALDFLLQDFLDQHPTGTLLNERLMVAPEVEIGASETGPTFRISINKGLRFSANISAETADILRRYHGDNTLADFLKNEAEQRHVPPEPVLSQFEVLAAQLIRYGFLIPIALAGSL